MKLARCTDGTEVFWARIDTDEATATPLGEAWSTWAPRLTADPGAEVALRDDVRDLELLRLLPPAEPTARVVAAGATYAKHVVGLGLKMPERPAAFLKPYSSLLAPGDDIAYPPVTSQLDYEVELVAVLGTAVRGVTQPIHAVLGYTVGNDVSARDLQFGGSVTGMDMFSAKALDDTCGLGPWIVTRDEFGDDHPDLDLRLEVDGELRQHDRTSSMVWGVAELLTYVDDRMALRSGDVLMTGTPSGVGHENGAFLRPGQLVQASIEALGTLQNRVAARKAD